MSFRFGKFSAATALAFSVLYFSGCVDPNANVNSSGANQTAVNTRTSNSEANSSPVTSNNAKPANMAVTLPVLDAMFADENFAADLKSKLNLTDEQINQLKQTAREATANLNEENEGSTAQARRRYEEKIKSIIGADKINEFSAFISERWSGGGDTATATTNQKWNSVPSDTRIVVNAPAYRMDVFKDGQLVRTYKVGIGYPEFPLPTGMRKASEIIFNPTWTPPDEPWVEGSNKVKPGQKIEAGSKLNPLGPIKIPIGLPSLIHGGKNPARLGTFASHGCVGLTSPQVQDFALALAQISGTQLTGEDVKNYEKAKTETKSVKLAQPIQVELRYETIVVEDGKLHVYRDVYERGTNTEENLRRVLETYGVSLDSLSEQEKQQALDALKQMSVDPAGNPSDGNPGSGGNANTTNANNKNGKNENKKDDSKDGKVTKNIKGQKEIVIEIAALKGKGYPAPVDLNTGTNSNKPLNSGGNSNSASNSNQQKETAAGKK